MLMARQLRIQYPGAIYHVMNRGDRREAIFREDADREALLAAPVEPVAGAGVDSGEVALGEILALRSLLLNLHFRAAKGEPVAEAEMRGLIERADGTKIERARERMEAVRAAAGLNRLRAQKLQQRNPA